MPVECLHQLYNAVADQDDGSSLLDVSLSTFQHGEASSLQTWKLVVRQLHDEEGFSVFVTSDPLDEQSAQEDQQDTNEVHYRADPGRTCEECTCKQCDNRDLSSARHERSQHCSRSSFSVVTDRTACHDSRDSASSTDDDRNDGLTGKTNTLENRVHNDADTSHITTVFQKCDQEIHYHYQRQEANYGANTADDTVCQDCLQQWRTTFQQSGYISLECFDPAYEPVSDPWTQLGLGDPEHRPHNYGEDHDTNEFVCDNSIDLILRISFIRMYFTLLYFAYDLVYECETLSVLCVNSFFIVQVDFCLQVRSLLTLAVFCNSRLDNVLQTLVVRGNRLDNRAAQLLGQLIHIDLCVLLFIDVALVERNDYRNSQFQKLCCEEQASAQVCSVYDIDDRIRMFVSDVSAGDTFFRCEW